MATGGAHAVKGGNWRIFKEMLDESKAGVYLNTTVRMPFSISLAQPLTVRFKASSR
jgi:hypothetical protein